MYNVALDLSPEQKYQLKLRVARLGTHVNRHVTALVLRDLEEAAKTESSKTENKSKK